MIACVALTAAVLIFVFMIEPDPGDSAPHRSHLDQLMERRDIIYDNLRDLKFEYRTGKFAEQDYEQMKQTLETEAALVLAEIENGHRQSRALAASRRRRARPRRLRRAQGRELAMPRLITACANFASCHSESAACMFPSRCWRATESAFLARLSRRVAPVAGDEDCFCALALGLRSHSAAAGTVTGVIHNGTNGKPSPPAWTSS